MFIQCTSLWRKQKRLVLRGPSAECFMFKPIRILLSKIGLHISCGWAPLPFDFVAEESERGC